MVSSSSPYPRPPEWLRDSIVGSHLSPFHTEISKQMTFPPFLALPTWARLPSQLGPSRLLSLESLPPAWPCWLFSDIHLLFTDPAIVSPTFPTQSFLDGDVGTELGAQCLSTSRQLWQLMPLLLRWVPHYWGKLGSPLRALKLIQRI